VLTVAAATHRARRASSRSCRSLPLCNVVPVAAPAPLDFITATARCAPCDLEVGVLILAEHVNDLGPCLGCEEPQLGGGVQVGLGELAEVGDDVAAAEAMRGDVVGALHSARARCQRAEHSEQENDATASAWAEQDTTDMAGAAGELGMYCRGGG
jgi:hypothetical protein